MNMSKKPLLGALLVAATAVIATAAVLSRVINFSIIARADTYTTTVTEEMLFATQIETASWEFSDKTSENEGKFRIDLDNGKYIDGAILYQDCGYQSIGPSMGDNFTLDNTTDPNKAANNFNFNIYFSVHGIKSVSVNRSQILEGEGANTTGSKSGLFSIKYIGKNSITSYFKEHTHGFCKNYSESSSTYADFHSWSSTVTNSWTKIPASCDNAASGCGLFKIQIQGTGLPFGQAVKFQLNYLTLTYTC